MKKLLQPQTRLILSYRKCPVFLIRNLAKEEGGQWADVVYWDSMKNASDAAKNIFKYDECREYFDMIDSNSSSMRHFEILSEI